MIDYGSFLSWPIVDGGYYETQASIITQFSPSDMFYGSKSASPAAVGATHPSVRGPGYPVLPDSGRSKLWFTYEELKDITNGFSSENLLGEGGFGCVYRGCLPDGRMVAVKQLKVGSGQGDREFKAEVEIISRVHHRHLVSLVGYCIDEHQRLLVYEYLPNKTLEYHLHGNLIQAEFCFIATHLVFFFLGLKILTSAQCLLIRKGLACYGMVKKSENCCWLRPWTGIFTSRL